MMKTISLGRNAAGLSHFAGCAAVSKARTLADGKSHFVSFGREKIRYVTVGEGKDTIVLVHCWAGNLGFWREQVPVLADKARLVLIDLPGHGRSGKPCATFSMDYFANAVLAVMQDAGVKQATLVGHSMGGPVIYRVYKQAPEKVAALVVVEGFLRRPLELKEAEKFVAQFRTPGYREHTRKFFGAMFPVPGTEALRDRVLSEMLDTPQNVMLGAMEGMFGPDQPDWGLKKTEVPVLVIHVKGSIWDTDGKDYVRSVSPRTDYRVMEGVGHWPMLEKPAEFNALLLDMLRKFDLVAQ